VDSQPEIACFQTYSRTTSAQTRSDREKLFPGWSKVPRTPEGVARTAKDRNLVPEGTQRPESSRNRTRRRVDVTQGRIASHFLRPVYTGLRTTPDHRSSHEASRLTTVSQHPKGLYSPFRERLCKVDVQIPGPNVFLGKGVDTHASTSVACVSETRERLTFAPHTCAYGRHHFCVAVT